MKNYRVCSVYRHSIAVKVVAAPLLRVNNFELFTVNYARLWCYVITIICSRHVKRASVINPDVYQCVEKQKNSATQAINLFENNNINLNPTIRTLPSIQVTLIDVKK